MTDVDYVIVFGSSNVAGFAAELKDVPATTFIRWAGTMPPLPWKAARSKQRPYGVTMPGTRMWTPRRPYTTNVLRNVLTSTATNVTFDGASLTPAVGSWFYIFTDPLALAWSSTTTYVADD